MRFELDIKATNSNFNLLMTTNPEHTQSKYKDNEILSNGDDNRLRGVMYYLVRANEDLIEDPYNEMNKAFFCGNELYFNNSEGYWINDRLKLYSLFISKSDRVIMSVEDIKKDRFIYFLCD